PEDIGETEIQRALYTADVPDPDLLIRTSGEMRVSNFLLWQIAYTELWITPTLWPDFGAADLYGAIAEFQRRTRRFGGVQRGMGMKRITLLGATGSIGLRTLDLVSSFPEEFQVAGLAARGSNIELIADLCRKYSPRAVALLDAGALDRLAQLLPAPRPELLKGADGLVALTRDVEADVVVSALVGGVGLLPTMAAILAGRTVALANKETLVVAGSLMTAAARARGVKLLPVDSEHSAVFQCLAGHNRADVHRIVLTASGRPFRDT